MQLIVREYDELQEWIALFIRGDLDILIIEGNPGIGKTSAVKHALIGYNQPFCWLEGRVSAIGLFEQLYDFQDCPIFLDDISSLQKDRHGAELLRGLCDLQEVKTLSWHTKAKLSEGVPRQFNTKSKVCFLCNQWGTGLAQQMLDDRGTRIMFQPNHERIHAYAQMLVTSKAVHMEVYEYIGRMLPTFNTLSLRYYVVASKLHTQSLIDWQACILQSAGVSPLHLEIINLESLHSRASDKAALFTKRTGKSETTYYRLRKELLALCGSLK